MNITLLVQNGLYSHLERIEGLTVHDFSKLAIISVVAVVSRNVYRIKKRNYVTQGRRVVRSNEVL